LFVTDGAPYCEQMGNDRIEMSIPRCRAFFELFERK
jgi:hypothetical protein